MTGTANMRGRCLLRQVCFPWTRSSHNIFSACYGISLYSLLLLSRISKAMASMNPYEAFQCRAESQAKGREGSAKSRAKGGKGSIERTSPHRRAPPPCFYLVQHCDSARRRVPVRHADGTFESRAHCEYHYGRWVTASRLSGQSNPWTKSPFISLFDNEGKLSRARARARAVRADHVVQMPPSRREGVAKTT